MPMTKAFADRIVVENLLSEFPFSSLLRAYLEQDAVYLSHSKRALLPIAGMPFRHCANAAERMMINAKQLCDDAELVADYPVLTIATTPLFQALAKRGALA